MTITILQRTKALRVTFIDDILNYDSLSIVGLQKNTGKTECLKYVLARLPLDRKRVAVTSIGIDGETTDQVTRTQKPEIVLREGMYFGTSEAHYRQRRLVSELIDVSDESTSLGRVVTARALTQGKILLSGPSSTSGLQRWMRDTRRHSIDLAIVDGALSRLSLASPAVSQSMILATGAAYSINMSHLIQHTAFIVDLINIGKTSECNMALLGPIDKGIWWIDTDGELHEMEAVTSLSQQVQFHGMERCKTIYVAGALVDSFLEKVRKNKSLKNVELVVRDFTKIFVTPQQLRLFEKNGGNIKVLQKSKLIAVTVNPTSPSGYVLDSDALCDKLSQAINLPVYDLLKN
ncbi:MAG: hypothetical protein IK100_04175 [Muribaculaceae bacterium]|nr:hypothetical protein [Muribaculaceae bacterium]